MTEPTPYPLVDPAQGDPGLLFDAYAKFPAERLLRVFTADEVEEYRAAWARLTSKSAALLGEKIASCPDSEIAAVVEDLVGQITDAVPASPYEGRSVADVKALVGDDVEKAKAALTYEQAHANRSTLVTALGVVIADGTVGIETRPVDESVPPRVGSVIDTVGGEQAAGTTS